MKTRSEDTEPPGDITALLAAWRRGNDDALVALMPLVYRQLKDIARRLLRSYSGHDTLQTTVLVHEAYLGLSGLESLSWQDRAHFFAMSARIMRRVLVDHARHQSRAKRGGGEPTVTLDELSPAAPAEGPYLLAVDEALRELAKHDTEMAQVVEMRFFGGLGREEIAEVLGVGSATVTRRWRTARAWLVNYLSQPA